MSKQMGAPSCFQRETTFMTSYLLPGKLSRSKLVSAIKEKNFFQGAKSFLKELISVKKICKNESCHLARISISCENRKSKTAV